MRKLHYIDGKIKYNVEEDKVSSKKKTIKWDFYPCDAGGCRNYVKKKFVYLRFHLE